MMTQTEIREASKAIAKMRPQPSSPRLTRKSRLLEVDHILADRELARLEAGEDVETPSHMLTERIKSNYTDNSKNARLGKQNSPWLTNGYFF